MVVMSGGVFVEINVRSGRERIGEGYGCRTDRRTMTYGILIELLVKPVND